MTLILRGDIYTERSFDSREVLSFKRFIPQIVTPTNFTGLERTITQLPQYKKEIEDALFSFVRGSTVSTYAEREIELAHEGSDIDLVVVTPRVKSKRIRSYEPEISINGTKRKVPMDILLMRPEELESQIFNPGESVSLLYDLVHDCHPLLNKEEYERKRTDALRTFLRLGLKEEEYLTPIRALRIISQAKMDINPLRWWSIEYCFAKSPRAKQNLERFYRDVEKMLKETLEEQIGEYEGEKLFRVPFGFSIPDKAIPLRHDYVVSRIISRLHRFPPLSVVDMAKISKKLQTMYEGWIEGKNNIDILFPQNC